MDGFLIPFSIFFFGFSLIWEGLAIAGAMQAPVAWIMPLFGLPFVMIGAFALFGRFYVDAALRQGTTYAVTDSRALIVRARPFPSFTAYRLAQLSDVSLKPGKDGRATIMLGAQTNAFFAFSAMNPFAVWLPGLSPQFLRVPDGARVFDTIQRAMGPRTAGAA